MDKTELKKLDAAALQNEILMMRKELFNLKISMISGQVKDVSQFKKLRKGIAQALTYLEMKQHSENVHV